MGFQGLYRVSKWFGSEKSLALRSVLEGTANPSLFDLVVSLTWKEPTIVYVSKTDKTFANASMITNSQL